MRWIDTKLSDESALQSDTFWEGHQKSLKRNEFWADKIKELKENPEEGLVLAFANLPLPAAFREAAIALRAMIRSERKKGLEWHPLLKQLYDTAAVNSMMLDYAPRLQQPGYNLMESIPGKVVTGLDYSYNTLGYRDLRLLNKTDVKWLVEAWGEPKTHTTLNAMHKSTWDSFEDALIKRQKKDSERFYADLASSRDHSTPPPLPQAGQSSQRKWWKFW